MSPKLEADAACWKASEGFTGRVNFERSLKNSKMIILNEIRYYCQAQAQFKTKIQP